MNDREERDLVGVCFHLAELNVIKLNTVRIADGKLTAMFDPFILKTT